MQTVDGDLVLSFLEDVDKVMSEAGVGQYRAFKLVHGLKAIGIVLKRDTQPALAPEPSSPRLVQTDPDAA